MSPLKNSVTTNGRPAWSAGELSSSLMPDEEDSASVILNIIQEHSVELGEFFHILFSKFLLSNLYLFLLSVGVRAWVHIKVSS